MRPDRVVVHEQPLGAREEALRLREGQVGVTETTANITKQLGQGCIPQGGESGAMDEDVMSGFVGAASKGAPRCDITEAEMS